MREKLHKVPLMLTFTHSSIIPEPIIIAFLCKEFHIGLKY